MIRRFLLLAGLILGGAISALAADDCLTCHDKETPAAVAQWRGSAHSGSVGCADCHGKNHEAIVSGKAPVEAKVCGRCHEQAYHQHVASRHGMGLHSGWGCTRAMAKRDPRECRFCHEEGSTVPKSKVHCARFLMHVITSYSIHYTKLYDAALRRTVVPPAQRGEEPDLPDHGGLFPEHVHILWHVQGEALPRSPGRRDPGRDR